MPGRYTSMLAAKKVSAGPPLMARIVRIQDMAVSLPQYELELRYAPMFRMGYVQVDYDHPSMRPGVLHMSPDTATWLHGMENQGGKKWGLLSNALRLLVDRSDSNGTNATEDLSQVVKVVRDSAPRRPVVRTDDRVVKVCDGIADLVRVMAPMCDGRSVDPVYVAETIERYTTLRDEMRSLREAMAQADGQFEVAQQYVIKMMEADQ